MRAQRPFKSAASGSSGHGKMWREGYCLEDRMRSPFISASLAQRILRAGKSLNFLRSEDPFMNVPLSSKHLIIALKFHTYVVKSKQDQAHGAAMQSLQSVCIAEMSAAQSDIAVKSKGMLSMYQQDS